MAKRMTELFVRTVRAQHARTEFRDGHTRGLVLRVTPNGTKTWAVIYRRKSTIGAYPAISLADARTHAQTALAAIARGEDPAGGVQARARSPTFGQLANAWVSRHGQPKRALARSTTMNSCWPTTSTPPSAR
ncbi:MAG TPA: Arm DNA-binding domain-containing protein [Sinorhizobium sp.]|nr:Arm DNA-binding domain-containing protein [Sinorhizobium sp.]